LKITMVMVAALFSVLYFGCESGNERNKNLEKIFVKTVGDYQSKEFVKIPLTAIFGHDWLKICVQEPYVSVDKFKALSGASDLRGFEYINDQYYVFWVFYNNGEHRWIKIKRSIIDMHPDYKNLCASKLNPYLYLKLHSYSTKENEKWKYYFQHKEMKNEFNIHH